MRNESGAASAFRPKVLVVGQGPPARGGIPTFVEMLLDDPWLQKHVVMDCLNTTPSREKRPGAADAANLRAAFADAGAIMRRARHVGVVHLNLSPAPLLPLLRALLLVLAARAAGARVVLHAHTGRLHASAARWSYRAALRAALLFVDSFVVVSRDAERAAARLGRGVVRLENAVDTGRIRPGPKADPPELLFVGTVCERKGLIDLRDALLLAGLQATKAGQVRVRIVGDGAQEGPGAFERIVSAFADAGLGGVEFLGAVERTRVIELLRGASMFCLPSHREGLPLSLLEAMAAGAAVLATDVGDVSLALDQGRAGLIVPPANVRALAAALRRLVDDPEERDRLAAAARIRVEERFSRDRLVRSIHELYVRASLRRRRP